MKPETEKLLQKASRSIRAAEKLLAEGDVDFALPEHITLCSMWPKRSSMKGHRFSVDQKKG